VAGLVFERARPRYEDGERDDRAVEKAGKPLANRDVLESRPAGYQR
jgi:hypothetical protein